MVPKRRCHLRYQSRQVAGRTRHGTPIAKRNCPARSRLQAGAKPPRLRSDALHPPARGPGHPVADGCQMAHDLSDRRHRHRSPPPRSLAAVEGILMLPMVQPDHGQGRMPSAPTPCSTARISCSKRLGDHGHCLDASLLAIWCDAYISRLISMVYAQRRDADEPVSPATRTAKPACRHGG